MRKRKLKLNRETLVRLAWVHGGADVDTNYCPDTGHTCQRFCPNPTTLVPSVDGCGGTIPTYQTTVTGICPTG